jgi:3-oxoacyl-[acyl-carrier-protein] synthase-3
LGADPRLVSGQLFSLSRELVEAVSTNIVQAFRGDPKLQGPYDMCFGHEVSTKVCDAVTRELGLRDVYFPTHHRFGNTVSASVSLGMSVAFQEGRLKRGDRVLLIVGASGVTVGLAAFTF